MMFTEQMLRTKAFTCNVNAERDQLNKCKVIWMLDYLNPCECTSVVMGRFNTGTPRRQFTPVTTERPLISDNIKTIRMHYGIVCEEEGSKYRLQELL